MSRATILLIDDDTKLLVVVADALRDEGYTVLTAAGGADGLRVASARAPDLILLDLVMPDIGGEEVLAELGRRNVATRVIVVTAHLFSLRHIIALAKAGACDYILKPFTLNVLLNAISRALALESTLNLRVANDPAPIINDLVAKAEERERENEVLQAQVRKLQSSQRWSDWVVKFASLVAASAIALVLWGFGVVTDAKLVVALLGVLFLLLLFPIDRLRSVTAKLPAAEATAEVNPPER